MTTLKPEDVTSFTLPAEIVNLELAEAYVVRWKRMVLSLPLSAPLKAKKAYAARLNQAEYLVMFHSKKK